MSAMANTLWGVAAIHIILSYFVMLYIERSRPYDYHIQGGPKSKPLSRIVIKSLETASKARVFINASTKGI